MAATLQLIYDFESDEFNPHLLLFFLNNDSKGLNGGIDLSHSSGEDKFKARVFVGTAFELLP